MAALKGPDLTAVQARAIFVKTNYRIIQITDFSLELISESHYSDRVSDIR